VHLLTNPQAATGGVVTVAGGRQVHYVTYGNGPTPLILMPGLGGEHGIYTWAGPIAKQLGLTVIVPWMPCHGPSCDVDTFSEAVIVMDQFREQAGGPECLIIGHSYGGAVATALGATGGRTVALAAPINPRFIGMSWLESQTRLGWVFLDLLCGIGMGAVESALRLDTHRYAPAVARTLLGGHRISLGIRVLRSMPDLTTHTRQAQDDGRAPLRLWGLADFGVQQPPWGMLPGEDWYLPFVGHGDFALRLWYPYPFIRRAVEVQLGRADPVRIPLLTQTAA